MKSILLIGKSDIQSTEGLILNALHEQFLQEEALQNKGISIERHPSWPLTHHTNTPHAVVIYGTEACQEAHNTPSATPNRLWIALGAPVHEKLMPWPKPFRFQALMRKIHHHFEQTSSQQSNHLALGHCHLDLKTRILHAPTQKQARLTEKEVGILSFLEQKTPQSASKDEILSNVWGYSSNLSTHTLETHIYRLRKKLHSFDKRTPLLETTKDGYRLILNSKES